MLHCKVVLITRKYVSMKSLFVHYEHQNVPVSTWNRFQIPIDIFLPWNLSFSSSRYLYFSSRGTFNYKKRFESVATISKGNIAYRNENIPFFEQLHVTRLLQALSSSLTTSKYIKELKMENYKKISSQSSRANILTYIVTFINKVNNEDLLSLGSSLGI